MVETTELCRLKRYRHEDDVKCLCQFHISYVFYLFAYCNMNILKVGTQITDVITFTLNKIKILYSILHVM